MKQKAGSLKKINKIGKTLARLTKKRRHKLPITRMKRNIATDSQTPKA